MAHGIEIVEASLGPDVAACRALFEEYQRGLGVSLCFQGFDHELASLPGDYAPPDGRLFLARLEGEPVGCVALRRLDGQCAELKRLYVRPVARGLGLGRDLALLAIRHARLAGYRAIKLDTLPAMAEAQALYAALGFRDTAPYNDNPIPGTRFLSLSLK